MVESAGTGGNARDPGSSRLNTSVEHEESDSEDFIDQESGTVGTVSAVYLATQVVFTLQRNMNCHASASVCLTLQLGNGKVVAAPAIQTPRKLRQSDAFVSTQLSCLLFQTRLLSIMGNPS